MKTDKEKLDILSQYIVKYYIMKTDNDYDRCRYCGCILTPVHDSLQGHHSASCPLLIAKNIEKETEDTKIDKSQLTEEQFNKMMIESSVCEYITPENYLRLTNNMKEKGYIIKNKEKPLIVHNVMSYKGKNYLLQKIHYSNSDPDKCLECDICKLPLEGREHFKCSETCRDNEGYYYWKSFEDIQITDELACMRKNIGDIYVALQSDGVYILKLIAIIEDECILETGSRYDLYDIRLATAEELQKYFKNE